MAENVLKATRRDVLGKQVKAMRREGMLPAVLYGRKFLPVPVMFDLKETSRMLGRLSASALVTINLEGEKHVALVREKQRDPLRGTLLHVDFMVVSMNEKLRTEVALVLTGESIAVKDFNGILVKNMETLEVECFPQDLPERIMVDISPLTTIGATIHVRDLVISDKVELLDSPDEIVVVVTAQAAEEVEEVKEVVEGVEGEPEVLEKGKKEEEEAEEKE